MGQVGIGQRVAGFYTGHSGGDYAMSSWSTHLSSTSQSITESSYSTWSETSSKSQKFYIIADGSYETASTVATSTASGSTTRETTSNESRTLSDSGGTTFAGDYLCGVSTAEQTSVSSSYYEASASSQGTWASGKTTSRTSPSTTTGDGGDRWFATSNLSTYSASESGADTTPSANRYWLEQSSVSKELSFVGTILGDGEILKTSNTASTYFTSYVYSSTSYTSGFTSTVDASSSTSTDAGGTIVFSDISNDYFTQDYNRDAANTTKTSPGVATFLTTYQTFPVGSTGSGAMVGDTAHSVEDSVASTFAVSEILKCTGIGLDTGSASSKVKSCQLSYFHKSYYSLLTRSNATDLGWGVVTVGLSTIPRSGASPAGFWARHTLASQAGAAIKYNHTWGADQYEVTHSVRRVGVSQIVDTSESFEFGASYNETYNTVDTYAGAPWGISTSSQAYQSSTYTLGPVGERALSVSTVDIPTPYQVVELSGDTGDVSAGYSANTTGWWGNLGVRPTTKNYVEWVSEKYTTGLTAGLDSDWFTVDTAAGTSSIGDSVTIFGSMDIGETRLSRAITFGVSHSTSQLFSESDSYSSDNKVSAYARANTYVSEYEGNTYSTFSIEDSYGVINSSGDMTLVETAGVDLVEGYAHYDPYVVYRSVVPCIWPLHQTTTEASPSLLYRSYSLGSPSIHSAVSAGHTAPLHHDYFTPFGYMGHHLKLDRDSGCWCTTVSATVSPNEAYRATISRSFAPRTDDFNKTSRSLLFTMLNMKGERMQGTQTLSVMSTQGEVLVYEKENIPLGAGVFGNFIHHFNGGPLGTASLWAHGVQVDATLQGTGGAGSVQKFAELGWNNGASMDLAGSNAGIRFRKFVRPEKGGGNNYATFQIDYRE